MQKSTINILEILITQVGKGHKKALMYNDRSKATSLPTTR